MGSFVFSIIISVLEKIFADKFAAHLENYHQEQKAKDIANAPQTKNEEVSQFNSW